MSSQMSVIIAGGGIGGLALAIMLDAAGIDYIVLERSSSLKTLGSTIALNACALRLLEQLGLWKDIQKIAKPIAGFNIQHDDLSPIGKIDFSFGEKHYGYYAYVMARPALFELLKSRVPAKNIKLRKHVVDIIEDDTGVTCLCEDGSKFTSDILVGADGAYSSVRESMYRRLKQQNRLPVNDQRPLRLSHLSILGVSKPIDPSIIPDMENENSVFQITLFKNSKHSVCAGQLYVIASQCKKKMNAHVILTNTTFFIFSRPQINRFGWRQLMVTGSLGAMAARLDPTRLKIPRLMRVASGSGAPTDPTPCWMAFAISPPSLAVPLATLSARPPRSSSLPLSSRRSFSRHGTQGELSSWAMVSTHPFYWLLLCICYFNIDKQLTDMPSYSLFLLRFPFQHATRYKFVYYLFFDFVPMAVILLP